MSVAEKNMRDQLTFSKRVNGGKSAQQLNISTCQSYVHNQTGDTHDFQTTHKLNTNTPAFIVFPTKRTQPALLWKVGGLITDKTGYIASDWRYDLGAHMPPPTGILEIKLNKSITFEFVDRGDMRIKFSQNGIIHELDAGVRPKREGTYIDNRSEVHYSR